MSAGRDVARRVANLRAADEPLALQQTVAIVLDLPGDPPAGAETLPDANCSLTGLGDQAGPEPEAPAVTRGQRPRPQSPEQREEALATLRQRARALRGCSPGERSRTFARRRAWPSPGGNRGVVDVLAGRPPGHRPAAGCKDQDDEQKRDGL